MSILQSNFRHCLFALCKQFMKSSNNCRKSCDFETLIWHLIRSPMVFPNCKRILSSDNNRSAGAIARLKLELGSPRSLTKRRKNCKSHSRKIHIRTEREKETKIVEEISREKNYLRRQCWWIAHNSRRADLVLCLRCVLFILFFLKKKPNKILSNASIDKIKSKFNSNQDLVYCWKKAPRRSKKNDLWCFSFDRSTRFKQI